MAMASVIMGSIQMPRTRMCGRNGTPLSAQIRLPYLKKPIIKLTGGTLSAARPFSHRGFTCCAGNEPSDGGSPKPLVEPAAKRSTPPMVFQSETYGSRSKPGTPFLEPSGKTYDNAEAIAVAMKVLCKVAMALSFVIWWRPAAVETSTKLIVSILGVAVGFVYNVLTSFAICGKSETGDLLLSFGCALAYLCSTAFTLYSVYSGKTLMVKALTTVLIGFVTNVTCVISGNIPDALQWKLHEYLKLKNGGQVVRVIYFNSLLGLVVVVNPRGMVRRMKMARNSVEPVEGYMIEETCTYSEVPREALRVIVPLIIRDVLDALDEGKEFQEFTEADIRFSGGSSFKVRAMLPVDKYHKGPEIEAKLLYAIDMIVGSRLNRMKGVGMDKNESKMTEINKGEEPNGAPPKEGVDPD